MDILVRRTTGTRFELVDGHMRLQATLAMDGKAAVVDVDSGEQFEVHVVDGEIVVLAGIAGAIAETRAAGALDLAAKPKDA